MPPLQMVVRMKCGNVCEAPGQGECPGGTAPELPQLLLSQAQGPWKLWAQGLCPMLFHALFRADQGILTD